MADGLEQLNFRLSAELKQATAQMREAAPMADILAAVFEVWGHTKPTTGEEFLSLLRGTLTATETNAALTERSKQIANRNRELTVREKELAKTEEESRERLRQLELKTRTAEERVKTVEAQHRRILAEVRLDLTLIQEIKSAFQAGYRPADLATLARLARALNLDPSKSAAYFRQFGGAVQAIQDLEKRKNTLTAEIDERKVRVTRLEAEIRSLQAHKTALTAEVGAALSTARREFAEGTGAAMTRLGEDTGASLARVEEATQAVQATAETFKIELVDFARQQLIEPFLRLAEAGLVYQALDGSPELDRLAVAARLLKTEIDKNGDTDLPKEAGEYGSVPRLSFVARKVWALAATRGAVPKEVMELDAET